MLEEDTQLYDKLIIDATEIISEVNNIEVTHEKIEPIKLSLLDGLNKHKNIFTKKAKKAKELSEWNDYTIAFFGETNAGKSTIIEALRILGNDNDKYNEYKQINKINKIIDNKNVCIQTLKKKIKITKQEIKSHLKKLQEKNKINDEVNADIEILEEKINNLNFKIGNKTKNINEIEKKNRIAKSKLESLKKEITSITSKKQKEVLRISKKENSLGFKITKWFGDLIKKNVTINNDFLEELKIEEAKINHTISEIENDIKSGDIIKEEEETFLKKTNLQIQDFKTSVEQLYLKDSIIKNEKLKIEHEIENSNKNIDEHINEINSHEAEIELKQKELKTLGDGKIIGTGKQDFTVDVKSYKLKFNNNSIILIDVPGIEGDEKKYTDMIKDAVSKAHAVFFVNGSNKKPEEKTLEKIKTYLQDQTEVYSITNIKGKADSYEFEEERISLIETHKDLDKTALLTKETLTKVLKDKYKGHLNIQGLLAFVANSKNIVRERNDLIRSRTNFFKHFETSALMRDFSNIDFIVSLIEHQQPFFKNKIKVANLQTIIGISSRFKNKLEHFQKHTISDESIKQIEREIDNYKHEIKVDLMGLESSFRNISHKLSNYFYTQLQFFIHHIIDKKFDEAFDLFPIKNKTNRELFNRLMPKGKDKEALQTFIKNYLEQLIIKIQKDFQNQIQKKLKLFFDGLQNKKKKISSRLKIINKTNDDKAFKDFMDIDIEIITQGFNYKNFLKKNGFNILKTVGNMAMIGVKYGNKINNVKLKLIGTISGAIIGAIIGIVVGSIISVVKFGFGGESTKAKKKKEIDQNLLELKNEFFFHLEQICEQTFKEVKQNTIKEENVLDICINGIRELQSKLINKISDIDSLTNNIIKEKEIIEKSYINAQ